MERNKFSKEEVVAYLEGKLLMNTATYEEEIYYQEYEWNGKVKKNRTYKTLVREMYQIWEQRF